MPHAISANSVTRSLSHDQIIHRNRKSTPASRLSRERNYKHITNSHVTESIWMQSAVYAFSVELVRSRGTTDSPNAIRGTSCSTSATGLDENMKQKAGHGSNLSLLVSGAVTRNLSANEQRMGMKSRTRNAAVRMWCFPCVTGSTGVCRAYRGCSNDLSGRSQVWIRSLIGWGRRQLSGVVVPFKQYEWLLQHSDNSSSRRVSTEGNKNVINP